MNLLQYIVVDDCWSNLVNAVSGVPKGSVSVPLLVLLHTSDHFSIVENKLFVQADYADEPTLVAVVSSPLERGAVV